MLPEAINLSTILSANFMMIEKWQDKNIFMYQRQRSVGKLLFFPRLSKIDSLRCTSYNLQLATPRSWVEQKQFLLPKRKMVRKDLLTIKLYPRFIFPIFLTKFFPSPLFPLQKLLQLFTQWVDRERQFWELCTLNNVKTELCRQ